MIKIIQDGFPRLLIAIVVGLAVFVFIRNEFFKPNYPIYSVTYIEAPRK